MKMKSVFNFIFGGDTVPECSYKTKQKSVILDCLKKNSDREFTVDGLVDLLKADGVCVGRTTVYRYLDYLVKTGDVRKFVSESTRQATFQYIEHKHECEAHMHLKCMKCGKLIHLSCDFMNGVCDHILSHHSFRVDNAKTTLLRLCEDCYKEENADGGH